jgi:uncharacterized protein with PQ loop repeat
MAINAHYHKYKKHSPKKPTLAIDRWVYFAVIATPILTLPQVYDIWMTHQKQGSAVTWTAYFANAFIWLLYGIKHNDRPIIAVQVIWLVMDAVIVVGLLR